MASRALVGQANSPSPARPQINRAKDDKSTVLDAACSRLFRLDSALHDNGSADHPQTEKDKGRAVVQGMDRDTDRSVTGFADRVGQDHEDREQHDHEIDPERRMKDEPEQGHGEPGELTPEAVLDIAAPQQLFPQDVQDEHRQPDQEKKPFGAGEGLEGHEPRRGIEGPCAQQADGYLRRADDESGQGKAE